LLAFDAVEKYSLPFDLIHNTICHQPNIPHHHQQLLHEIEADFGIVHSVDIADLAGIDVTAVVVADTVAAVVAGIVVIAVVAGIVVAAVDCFVDLGQLVPLVRSNVVVEVVGLLAEGDINNLRPC
jgi:hypothetical protein